MRGPVRAPNDATGLTCPAHSSANSSGAARHRGRREPDVTSQLKAGVRPDARTDKRRRANLKTGVRPDATLKAGVRPDASA